LECVIPAQIHSIEKKELNAKQGKINNHSTQSPELQLKVRVFIENRNLHGIGMDNAINEYEK
jgi:hypothetical protein